MNEDDKLDFLAAILTISIEVRSSRFGSAPATAVYSFKRIKDMLLEHGTAPVPRMSNDEFQRYLQLLDEADPESEAS